MKTKLYFGPVHMIPSYANVDFVSDKKRTDYTLTLTYSNELKLSTKLESINVHGFWIANAMCMN